MAEKSSQGQWRGIDINPPDLSVAIPYINNTKKTYECIQRLYDYSSRPIELILINNGSTETLENIPPFWGTHMIVNKKNLGVLPTLRQSAKIANSPYLLHMHNDVLIQERGWENRIIESFEQDDKLALIGFFGSAGIGENGARLAPESNMLGLEWGTPGNLHGSVLTGLKPSTIFDSLAMCFRLDILNQVGIPDDMPPHHWYDRIMTLRIIDAGWRAATLGIAFDHDGGGSSGGLMEFSKNWCEENGLDPGENPDLTMYMYGLSIFDRDYAWRLPLYVDMDYNYRWRR